MVEEGDDELFECGGGGRKEFANLSNCCSRLIWKICFLLKVLAKFYAPAVWINFQYAQIKAGAETNDSSSSPIDDAIICLLIRMVLRGGVGVLFCKFQVELRQQK